jgi:hypothetical protein
MRSEIAPAKDLMKILLYNPDNGVTRNFMPHLWMFLLQALTPPGHEVVLIDGNAQPMNEEGNSSPEIRLASYRNSCVVEVTSGYKN